MEDEVAMPRFPRGLGTGPMWAHPDTTGQTLLDQAAAQHPQDQGG